MRLTSGNDDANGTAATDASGVTSFLNWQASNGGLYFETRIAVSRITNAYIYAGFTDVITHWPRADGVYAGSEDVLVEAASRFA